MLLIAATTPPKHFLWNASARPTAMIWVNPRHRYLPPDLAVDNPSPALDRRHRDVCGSFRPLLGLGLYGRRHIALLLWCEAANRHFKRRPRFDRCPA
jgi:hypothetical protein